MHLFTLAQNRAVHVVDRAIGVLEATQRLSQTEDNERISQKRLAQLQTVSFVLIPHCTTMTLVLMTG